jgi:hypothetical protein
MLIFCDQLEGSVKQNSKTFNWTIEWVDGVITNPIKFISPGEKYKKTI